MESHSHYGTHVPLTPHAAVAFVKGHGIVLVSARGAAPNLVSARTVTCSVPRTIVSSGSLARGKGALA
jgi:hypothetical protein